MSKGKGHKPIAASSRRAARMTWIGGGIGLAAVLIVGVALFAGRADDAGLPVVEVYKDPNCGCCSKWVEHLQEHGFTVHATDTDDLGAVKATHGVPPEVESCHTGVVAGYVIEGHVPAADVQRLLNERPAVAGLAVAGMPVGSPGMEIAGAEIQPYDVMAFDEDRRTHVFATHGR